MPRANADPGVPQGWSLEFLYTGTDDLQGDLRRYRADGAHRVWHFRRNGSEVCAVSRGAGPLTLLANERPPGSVVPMFSVPHLDATSAALEAHGWEPLGEPFDIPPGPCRMVREPGGIEFAIFENVRPDVMDRAYADRRNPRAIRGGP